MASKSGRSSIRNNPSEPGSSSASGSNAPVPSQPPPLSSSLSSTTATTTTAARGASIAPDDANSAGGIVPAADPPLNMTHIMVEHTRGGDVKTHIFASKNGQASALHGSLLGVAVPSTPTDAAEQRDSSTPAPPTVVSDEQFERVADTIRTSLNASLPRSLLTSLPQSLEVTLPNVLQGCIPNQVSTSVSRAVQEEMRTHFGPKLDEILSHVQQPPTNASAAQTPTLGSRRGSNASGRGTPSPPPPSVAGSRARSAAGPSASPSRHGSSGATPVSSRRGSVLQPADGSAAVSQAAAAESIFTGPAQCVPSATDPALMETLKRIDDGVANLVQSILPPTSPSFPQASIDQARLTQARRELLEFSPPPAPAPTPTPALPATTTTANGSQVAIPGPAEVVTLLDQFRKVDQDLKDFVKDELSKINTQLTEIQAREQTPAPAEAAATVPDIVITHTAPASMRAASRAPSVAGAVAADASLAREGPSASRAESVKEAEPTPLERLTNAITTMQTTIAGMVENYQGLKDTVTTAMTPPPPPPVPPKTETEGKAADAASVATATAPPAAAAAASSAPTGLVLPHRETPQERRAREMAEAKAAEEKQQQEEQSSSNAEGSSAATVSAAKDTKGAASDRANAGETGKQGGDESSEEANSSSKDTSGSGSVSRDAGESSVKNATESLGTSNPTEILKELQEMSQSLGDLLASVSKRADNLVQGQDDLRATIMNEIERVIHTIKPPKTQEDILKERNQKVIDLLAKADQDKKDVLEAQKREYDAEKQAIEDEKRKKAQEEANARAAAVAQRREEERVMALSHVAMVPTLSTTVEGMHSNMTAQLNGIGMATTGIMNQVNEAMPMIKKVQFDMTNLLRGNMEDSQLIMGVGDKVEVLHASHTKTNRELADQVSEAIKTATDVYGLVEDVKTLSQTALIHIETWQKDQAAGLEAWSKKQDESLQKWNQVHGEGLGNWTAAHEGEIKVWKTEQGQSLDEWRLRQNEALEAWQAAHTAEINNLKSLQDQGHTWHITHDQTLKDIAKSHHNCYCDPATAHIPCACPEASVSAAPSIRGDSSPASAEASKPAQIHIEGCPNRTENLSPQELAKRQRARELNCTLRSFLRDYVPGFEDLVAADPALLAVPTEKESSIRGDRGMSPTPSVSSVPSAAPSVRGSATGPVFDPNLTVPGASAAEASIEGGAAGPPPVPPKSRSASPGTSRSPSVRAASIHSAAQKDPASTDAATTTAAVNANVLDQVLPEDLYHFLRRFFVQDSAGVSPSPPTPPSAALLVQTGESVTAGEIELQETRAQLEALSKELEENKQIIVRMVQDGFRLGNNASTATDAGGVAPAAETSMSRGVSSGTATPASAVAAPVPPGLTPPNLQPWTPEQLQFQQQALLDAHQAQLQVMLDQTLQSTLERDQAASIALTGSVTDAISSLEATVADFKRQRDELHQEVEGLRKERDALMEVLDVQELDLDVDDLVDEEDDDEEEAVGGEGGKASQSGEELQKDRKGKGVVRGDGQVTGGSPSEDDTAAKMTTKTTTTTTPARQKIPEVETTVKVAGDGYSETLVDRRRMLLKDEYFDAMVLRKTRGGRMVKTNGIWTLNAQFKIRMVPKDYRVG